MGFKCPRVLQVAQLEGVQCPMLPYVQVAPSLHPGLGVKQRCTLGYEQEGVHPLAAARLPAKRRALRPPLCHKKGGEKNGQWSPLKVR